MHKQRAIFQFEMPDATWREGFAVGRNLETLDALIAHPEGVEVLNFPGGPAYRLAAYVHQLREQGLDIETESIAHNGGWHARYVLKSTVRIVRRWAVDSGAAA
jgi:hypothetical protein